MRVGEVAKVSADALLEALWTLGEVEHLVVVIGFQYEDISKGDVMFHDGRRVPKVGEPGDAFAGSSVLGWAVDGEADGVRGVMRNRNRSDLQPALFKGGARFEELPIHVCFDGLLDPTGGFTIGEDFEQRILAEQGAQSDAVVGVLMGDEDGVNRPCFQADFLQGRHQPWALKARI